MTKFGVATSKWSAATPAIGPKRVVRRDPAVGDLGHGRDLPGLAEAADMAEIGLGDVDRTGAQQLVELAPVDQPLAGGERDAGLRLDRGQPQGLARRQRLLDEHRPERRQRLDILQRHRGGAAAAVEVDHDLDLLADRLADRAHAARHLVDLARARRVVGVGDEHGLQGPVAPLDHLVGALDQRRLVQALVDRGHLAEAEMGVDRHPVAGTAAEQAPDRHAQRFAEDVLAGHLDAGDGAHADHAEPPEAVLGQHADQLLDVARVAAEQERRQVLDGADHRARLPLQRRLAPAVQAGLVGADLDEDPVPHRGVDDERAYAGDLHGLP